MVIIKTYFEILPVEKFEGMLKVSEIVLGFGLGNQTFYTKQIDFQCCIGISISHLIVAQFDVAFTSKHKKYLILEVLG